MSQMVRKFLTSRKVWAFVGGLITLITISYADNVFTPQEIQNIAATIIGFMGSVALEDGLSNFNAPKRDTTLGNPQPNAVNWNSFKQSVNWNSLTETEKEELLEMYFNA
jgi:hypothetical protein